jgi:hypothetical protein
METFSLVKYKKAFCASSSLLKVIYQQSDVAEFKALSQATAGTGQCSFKNKSDTSFSVASNGTSRKIIIQRLRVGYLSSVERTLLSSESTSTDGNSKRIEIEIEILN